ncbi:ion transporter [Desulfosporosinus shakirovi]|uniref:ion transporter n=1 Tax=Desulfosporosinus shakirovi TaxID=2885154 RepID=UPI001E2B78C1|nr:ion transporter [Desulfosporosinus sp. SRJS8]MCB8814526.1 ion transporter [Desulfosporosinus sp. SRJS8]
MGTDQKSLSLKEKLFIIIFKADTRAGRAFDIALLWLILISILSIFLESLPSLSKDYLEYLYWIEWVITVLFTIEYIARICIVRSKLKYLKSFFGIIDLLAILPAYLSIFIAGSQFALILRIFRLLRVFRVLNLGRYVGESYSLLNALKASRFKITVFLEAVLVIVVIVGTLMYLIEGEISGFDSIPISVYWTIVTLTTVGFGDITPITPLGRVVASLLMLLGYGVIAVPTGIVSSELARTRSTKGNERSCPSCSIIIEDEDANYCKNCGQELEH